MLEPKYQSISSYILFVLFTFLFISAVSAQSVIVDRNVLVVGVSGLRGDAFMAANTQNFDKFMNAGEYSYDCDVGMKTVNGPSWATVLTGVWYKKHNIKSDDFKKPMLDIYPHYYKYLEGSGLRTASVVNWEPINTQIDCCSDLPTTCQIDRAVNEKGIELIREDAADVLFVQYSDVNEAGTLSKFHPESGVYVKSIERMDRYFADLIAEVKAHAVQHQEEWMIIVCTDHGGDGVIYEGKQKLTEVRMVPQALGICKTNGEIGIEMDHFYPTLSDAANVNIVPTVLDYLGIAAPADLDGTSYLMSIDNVTDTEY